jgi:actin related protein 2/3 complex subunit 5
MKYLYKGMGMPGWGDVSGSVLLGWHEKVCPIPHLSALTFFLTQQSVNRGRRDWLYR